MAKVSVVVPVYNVEKYLAQCVDSLITQTLSDIEVILVDDTSTDGSLALAKKYSYDARVRVFTKPHGGLGDTRNWGVARARGEYLAFVDSDDWLEPEALATLYNSARVAQAELVVFNYVRENTEDGEARTCGLPLNYPVFEPEANEAMLAALLGPAAVPDAWTGAEMLGCAWRRLYHRAWFLENGFLFPNEQEVMLEDLPVTIQAHFLAERVLFMGGAYYHYRYNPASLSTRYRPRKMEMLLKCYELVRGFLEERCAYEPYAERHLAWLYRQAAHGALVNCFSPASPTSFSQRWQEVRGILRQPLVRNAAKSGYLKNGTRADQLVREVIRSRNTAVAYVFYKLYSATLRRDPGRK